MSSEYFIVECIVFATLQLFFFKPYVAFILIFVGEDYLELFTGIV